MTNQIDQLDKDIEQLGLIADELERQVETCPTSRLRLLAWLADWFKSPTRLVETSDALPELSPTLISAYTAWIYEGGGR
ncbi:hypothetical protein ACI2KG_05100 [Pseudomonas sp. NPDC089407]|uniref:hypothetical protein n=1 Tax=Pseudomonas sp. NPDC089407 TaxID=3364464 RepID=UPI00384F7DE2